MLAMLTDMDIIPHKHFGMPGDIQKHTLVYTVIAAGVLAAFFDLSRIASLGAIFYLVMDIMIHWGVLRHLRDDIGANPVILLAAIALDALVLSAFVILKWQSDPLIIAIAIALAGNITVFAFEKFYLSSRRPSDVEHASH